MDEKFVRLDLTRHWTRERDIILESKKTWAGDYQPWRHSVEALGGAAAGGRRRPLIERLAGSAASQSFDYGE
jgi:hypothetical protein